jgi:hypothetical protein
MISSFMESGMWMDPLFTNARDNSSKVTSETFPFCCTTSRTCWIMLLRQASFNRIFAYKSCFILKLGQEKLVMDKKGKILSQSRSCDKQLTVLNAFYHQFDHLHQDSCICGNPVSKSEKSPKTLDPPMDKSFLKENKKEQDVGLTYRSLHCLPCVST